MSQVYATAAVKYVEIDSNPPFTSFIVQYAGSVSDGSTEKNFGENSGSSTGGLVFIPFGTPAKQADNLIREAISAEILSFAGFVVAPEDVYIPFSRKE